MIEQAGTVLCVDDDEATRYAVRKTLERGGFRVALAETGEEALEKIRLSPDLVLLDVQLPGLSGREVCRRIKTDPLTAAIPVVHFSATFVDPQDHILGLESGADAYLVEPLAPGLLLATVRALVRARRSELERARLNEELREALRAREDVLAVVSHDLRNPLSTVILGAHRLVALLDGAGDPEWRADACRRLDTIRRAAERATSLVSGLLELARMEAGRIQMQVDRVDSESLVAEAIDAFRPLALEKRIQLSGNVLGRATVLCERERIEQVFSNLVGNALKFSSPGGSVKVGLEPRGDEVVFWVADKGPGIGPEQLPHVFERYWQARQRSHSGIGLGLSIAKGIVEAHGGRIWVESQLGRGTTFHFTLKAAPFRRDGEEDRFHGGHLTA